MHSYNSRTSHNVPNETPSWRTGTSSVFCNGDWNMTGTGVALKSVSQDDFVIANKESSTGSLQR